MIYKTFDEVNLIPENRCVALGLFDSLHSGHLSVINEMLRISKEENLVSTVQTFSKFRLKGNRMVLTLDERKRIFNELNVEDIIVLEFNETIRNSNPKDFVNDLIVNKLNAKVVVCGSDYTFGHGGRGDINLLSDLLQKNNVKLKIVDEVLQSDEQKVSTSAIKTLLDNGDVKTVAKLCNGRLFEYEGIIETGNRLGRTLGFPTINILIPEDKYVVRRGVYLTRTIVEGRVYNSISNVGKKPTIVEEVKKDIIETHLYDFDDDIYGKEATVQLMDFVRDERLFKDIDELKRQVLSDKDYCYERHINGGI